MIGPYLGVVIVYCGPWEVLDGFPLEQDLFPPHQYMLVLPSTQESRTIIQHKRRYHASQS